MSPADTTTAREPFHPMEPSTGHLCEVRAGIPAAASLEQASRILACVYRTLQDIAEAPHTESIYGAVYLVAMAKAAIDAVTPGLTRQQGGAA